MNKHISFAVAIVFFATLAATFLAAAMGRKHADNVRSRTEGLSGQRLNKWLIGLSAGAAANSGFVVTGAVGLGYAYGLHWLFLPIAWLVGDIVFWYFFPARINSTGRQCGATTLSDLLSKDLCGVPAHGVSLFAAVLIVICLGGYTAAQWLAGQKFLAGAFGMPSIGALAAFAVLIIAYTMIGGFRGSVYADSVQAVIRIIGTIVALGAVIGFAVKDPLVFRANISAAGPAFVTLAPGNTLVTSLTFILGFASAALGFGLGQPQLVSRYLAGSSPQETRAAWWIYIGFVQFTWIAMTLFGILLRGVMPGIADPEAGLSLFFTTHIGSVITGVIVADIFATIAATSNSILVAMAQAVTHNILPTSAERSPTKHANTAVVVILGGATMICSLLLGGKDTVFQLAIGAASFLGAGLAAPVMIQVMHWRRTGSSLLASMLAGLTAAIAWKYAGLGGLMNEAAVGIFAGLVVNSLALRVSQLTLQKAEVEPD